MPQARPLKRPSDADDTSLTDNRMAAKVKLPRLERGPAEFSSVVKSKLQSYTRTGQACDRCKVRKIRCDALPEGCTNCNNQGTECYVTDRVSGRTERRGYMQQLELEKSAMLNHIRDLEKLLESKGVETLPWDWSTYNTSYPPGVALDSMGNPVQDPSSSEQWQQVGSVWVRDSQQKPSSGGGYTRYSLLESRPNDSYLGVSSDSEPLSSIKGTTLSILGTTIDITSFDAPDMDEPPPGTPIGSPLYNKSVMAFLQSTLNFNPPLENVELPSRQDAFTYSEWFFLMISPFLPILHKPSFLQLLTRIYDDPTFKASVPELVIVHMVFATIYFQYGIRNREEPEKHAQLNDLSNKHYHWCLSKFFDLAISQSVATVQALAMVVSHTRNFPKPGCSSTIAHFAIMKAIELNLHRAVKIPGGGTNLDNEIRKRTWWSILGVMVTLNGRLGRPMPITLEEFDVDFPIAIPDDCLVKDGILDPSKIGQCNYQVGLMGFKVVPLYMEMYSNIYGVRRDPKKYVQVVRELEDGMRNLLENLPDELRVEKCKMGDRVFALYCQAFCLEFTLCLRHPSVCMTKDPKFCAENTRVCEDTAREMLKVVGALLLMKSLDTTWYQLSVYVAAIFSTLVAHWERRFETSAHEFATLRDEMRQWLDIIQEIGQLLGTGNRMATEVSTIIERTLSWIERDMHGKSGSPPNQPKPTESGYRPPPSLKQTSETSAPLLPNSTNEQRGLGTTTANGYYETSIGPSAPYPPLNFEQATNGGDAHTNGNGVGAGTAYDPSNATYLYPTPSASTPSQSLPGGGVEQPAPPPPNPLIAFASQAAQHVTGGQGGGVDDWRPQAQASQLMAAAAAQQAAAGNTWHDWTAAMADSQDRYSASALLTLGSSRPGGGGGGGLVDHVGPADVLGIAGVASSHTGQWPLLLFHDGTGAGGGA
ncbi:hypothetical protein B0T22DRAFT_449522 [Podospora appendiculata]|uniref:Zn(2)-C6 fungal-type domain-containing protein n=1 Tax=Podospora appendiculata TaxID=314037 RepID=A0AAE0XGZ4_9PEZI|nr:hypothetical protein B0T22DRAFT_449522 [Podospora appendiculata]